MRSSARGVAFIIAGAVGLCSLALLADESSARSGGRSLDSHGLSIVLPAGWIGRVVKRSPRSAPQLIAASFRLPDREDFDFPGRQTARLMRAGSIYISIANLGSVNGKAFQGSPWKQATLPIRIRRADLRPFEGAYSPSEAVRWVVVERKALLLLVAFGRQHPTDAQLARANRVLSKFRLSRTR